MMVSENDEQFLETRYYDGQYDMGSFHCWKSQIGFGRAWHRKSDNGIILMIVVIIARIIMHRTRPKHSKPDTLNGRRTNNRCKWAILKTAVPQTCLTRGAC